MLNPIYRKLISPINSLMNIFYNIQSNQIDPSQKSSYSALEALGFYIETLCQYDMQWPSWNILSPRSRYIVKVVSRSLWIVPRCHPQMTYWLLIMCYSNRIQALLALAHCPRALHWIGNCRKLISCDKGWH